jgi:Domain of unknown function (DUF222)/HNH endonuclease
LDLAAQTASEMASLACRFLQVVGEIDRREGWRVEGATSLEAWISARCGMSVPTARAYAKVAQRLWDLPHLTEAFAQGAVSFDKARVVADVATPESDRELSEHARTCTMRELGEYAQAARQAERLAAAERSAASPASDDEADRDSERRSLRFNDTFRTVTVQLPPESYAEIRTTVEAAAREIPSNGTTPWDERLCDGFLSVVRSGGSGAPHAASNRYLVVAHVPLADLLADEGATATRLGGELERGGLLRMETVRRIACDSTVIIAVDDDVGHTMYEGRARRFPTESQRREIRRRDRHCRFPGCGHMLFTNAHHIRPWQAGGRTDLENLALLCEYHHRLLHSRQWSMSGDANEELTFVGPTGRAMTSRPSPLWTLTPRARDRGNGAGAGGDAGAGPRTA